MVIFWIFAALVSLSAFGYGMILMQWGLVGSLLFALAVLIFCRGLITWMRRSLILRERIADDEDSAAVVAYSRRRLAEADDW